MLYLKLNCDLDVRPEYVTKKCDQKVSKKMATFDMIKLNLNGDQGPGSKQAT